jgi:hypothetical protein
MNLLIKLYHFILNHLQINFIHYHLNQNLLINNLFLKILDMLDLILFLILVSFISEDCFISDFFKFG